MSESLWSLRRLGLLLAMLTTILLFISVLIGMPMEWTTRYAVYGYLCSIAHSLGVIAWKS